MMIKNIRFLWLINTRLIWGVCDLRKPHTSVLMFLDVGAMSCENVALFSFHN